MKWVAPAALAAVMLSRALPRAFADADTHWLIDANSSCSLFDANAQGRRQRKLVGRMRRRSRQRQKAPRSSRNSGKQFESFTGEFAKGIAQDGPVSVGWGGGWHYDGNEVGGQFSGAGVLMNDAKDRFEGVWVAGKMSGHGTLVRANGERYDGEWKDDLPNGQGDADPRRRPGGEEASSMAASWKKRHSTKIRRSSPIPARR